MNLSEWYNAGVSKCKASKTLFLNNDFHNSVYIGGYSVEILFKIHLLLNGFTEGQLYVHLNSYKKINGVKEYDFLINELRKLYSIYPEYFSDLDLQGFPLIINGKTQVDSNNKRWNPEYRYNASSWDNFKFAEEIQEEVRKAYECLENLKMGGRL